MVIEEDVLLLIASWSAQILRTWSSTPLGSDAFCGFNIMNNLLTSVLKAENTVSPGAMEAREGTSVCSPF